MPDICLMMMLVVVQASMYYAIQATPLGRQAPI